MLNDSISVVKSIGPLREKLFNKLGIFTVEDMLRYYPRTYEDRSKIKNICDVSDGECVLIKACAVTVVKNNRIRRGLSLQKLRVCDDTGVMEITWFNQDWISKSFDLDADYFFFGTVRVNRTKVEMSNPVYEKVDGAVFINRIMPIYSLTGGLTQKNVQSTALSCLSYIKEEEETIPGFMREENTLCGIDYALENIHFPKDREHFLYARKRLAFEEFFYMQLAVRLLRQKRTTLSSVEIKDEGYIAEFLRNLPFELTKGQKEAVFDIARDMEGIRPMNRLLQGDVGCGKTVVCAVSIYLAVKNGYQAVLMAPTEILARQHFESFLSMFSGYGINICLLTGGMKKKQREETLEKIKSGEIDVVIGTHAVIRDEVSFLKLALAVTDEQHRFGVKQRASLFEKGICPHSLVMSATPIPRTMALIAYGDLDISSIRELPPGRQKVDTFCVSEDMRKRINNFILKQVSNGRQVYVVCPMVSESETMEDVASVLEYTDKLRRDLSGKVSVCAVHGKMKSTEKQSVMEAFSKGEISVLVSTTVIEVGVNVKNANTMIIENAERFGLSQLHQLRGRVGRGVHKSYCIMFCESKSDIARQRMDIMTKTNDGFLISEKDLELRGPGEFLGTRQHGNFEFKIGNLYKDTDIISDAKKYAEKIADDPDFLSVSDRKMILKNLDRLYGSSLFGLN